MPEPTYRELMMLEERLALIDTKLPAARKLVELLEESRALYVDRRERIISAVANIVEAQAQAFGDDSIAARYEKTRTYRSAIALKAARTRRRNQEEQDSAEEVVVDAGQSVDAGQPAAPSVPVAPANDATPSNSEAGAANPAAANG